jgi:uncharacterized Zn finger protein
MRIDCNHCDYELNLDHKVFQNYEGPIKCFCCGTVMDIKAKQGKLDVITSSSLLPPHSTKRVFKHTPKNPQM